MANQVKSAMKAAAEAALNAKKSTEVPTEPKPAPVVRTGSILSDRLKGMQELVKGDRESRVLQRVDPSRCRMWAHHNRRYTELNEHNCQDLIEGFRAMGKQEFPAIVREVKGEEGIDFEIICGRRRHWTASFVGWKFLIEVRDLSDEEAFRLSDIENRDRLDISDYERAVDYKEALGRYYDSLRQMARRLEVDAGWLSRYIDLAELPDEIVRTFGSMADIKVNHVRDLKPVLDDPAKRNVVIEKAMQVEEEQRGLKERGMPPLEGREVVRRLLNVASVVRRGGRETVKAFKLPGMTKPYLIMEKGSTGTFTLKLTPNKVLTSDELRRAFEEIVDHVCR